MRGSGTRQRPLSLLQKQNQNQKQPDLPPFAAFAAAGAEGLLIFEHTLI